MKLLLASLSDLECLELFEVLLQMWVMNWLSASLLFEERKLVVSGFYV